MEYKVELLQQMVQFGTLGYPLSKILNIADIEDKAQFTRDFDNPDSTIAQKYQQGLDKAQFLLDTKLFNMAKGGDLTALQEFENRKRQLIEQERAEKRER